MSDLSVFGLGTNGLDSALCGLEFEQALAVISECDEQPFGFDVFDAP
jgi:hypothetical protein